MPAQLISQNAEILKDYIKTHIESLQVGRRQLFEINGERIALDVYRLPLELLHYNIKNGRFAAELKDREAVLDRSLDPEIEEDAKEIEKLLLKDKIMRQFLSKDLERIGQLSPGVITFDGSIIDGNRRAAILRGFSETKGNPKFDYFETVMLPETIRDGDLWRIEAGIQLSTDLQATYGPINELLKIREGKTYKLSNQAIGIVLGGANDDVSVKFKLDVLSQIEKYLEFIGCKFQYTKAEGLVEHFIDLQNIVNSKAYKALDVNRRIGFLQAAYRYIQNGVSHLDIRTLKKAFKVENGVDELIRKSFEATGDAPLIGVPSNRTLSEEIAEITAIAAEVEPQESDSIEMEIDNSQDLPDSPSITPSCNAPKVVSAHRSEAINNQTTQPTVIGASEDIRQKLEDILSDTVERADVIATKSKPVRILNRVKSSLETLNELDQSKLQLVKVQIKEVADLAISLNAKVGG